MYTLYYLYVPSQPLSIYIGITRMTLRSRLEAHRRDARAGKPNKKSRWLYTALQKKLEISIHGICTSLDEQSAFRLERELIILCDLAGFEIQNTNPGGKPNWESAHTPACREKARLGIQQAHSRSWQVRYLSANPLVITNLKQFCREQGLDASTMLKVADGKQSHHKGWTCERLFTPRMVV